MLKSPKSYVYPIVLTRLADGQNNSGVVLTPESIEELFILFRNI